MRRPLGKACDAAPGNFVRTVIAIFFTKLNDATASPKITLAWLMRGVGAPASLVGLPVPIRVASSLLPQLVIAGFIRRLAFPIEIMKYFILDLSPNNSMVKFLVDQGHAVFMISWRNPTEEDRDLDMDDYLELGVVRALEAFRAMVTNQCVHAVGYCIGGTLLSIVAAALGRDDKHRLKSMTLFAAQTDFTEAGEPMLFTDQSQVSYLEDLMWDKAYLDTKQMAGAFQLLRSNGLIWSRIVHAYLMGERAPSFHAPAHLVYF